ncbi:LAQU0S03e01992g1_1 [Lachancea quebecensis]|uniref:ATP-dependent DNA helicase II subunit 1 n=1 Tax=Lachancea quebecensis TaxID=1654605 RepID=A0A0N7ML64_9SACH|nr:LAQU0S03e01992g1_1 [Lachancea quebecensis]
MKDMAVDNQGKDSAPRYKKFEVHEGIIFCVELSEAMFKEPSDLNKVQLLEILETLLEVMTQAIMTLPGTGIGCFFFQCSREGAKGGIYEFLPLLDVNARSMKKLNDLLDDLKMNVTSMSEQFPFDTTQSSSLETLFILLQEQFLRNVSGQKAYNNKKIFLFTDNDHPRESSDHEVRKRLRKVIDDLDDSFINITPFFVGSKERPFDQSFYSDILKLGARNKTMDGLHKYDGPNTNPISAKLIKTRALRKKEIKRVRFQCPLILNEASDFQVSIKGYTTISHERAGSKYKQVYDHDGLQKEILSHRKYLDANTGEDVTPRVVKVFKFAEVDIELSEDEMARMNRDYSSYESFLRLIGFRDTQRCVFYYNNISNSSFVVPDDSVFEGSIKTMASLFRKLREKQKSAVVWGKLKNNSNPSLYTLTPSNLSDHNEGFYLTRIPFLDEVRKFPPTNFHGSLSGNKTFEQMCKITETLISFFSLRHSYKPSDFRNPTLQKHFELLHDYLLQVEIDPASGSKENLLKKDDTLVKLHQVRAKILESAESDDPTQARLSNYVKAWNSMYNREFNGDTESENAAKKSKK